MPSPFPIRSPLASSYSVLDHFGSSLASLMAYFGCFCSKRRLHDGMTETANERTTCEVMDLPSPFFAVRARGLFSCKWATLLTYLKAMLTFTRRITISRLEKNYNLREIVSFHAKKAPQCRQTNKTVYI